MPEPITPPAAETKIELPKELRDLITDFKAKGDDKTAKLIRDNYRLRERVREAEGLKSKLPGDGDIVLKGDDAKAWKELNKLGPIKDLPARLSLSEADTAELAKFRTADATAKAAEIAGFKASTLGRFARADAIEFEFGTEKQDGTDVPTVSVKGADGKLIPLKTYAENHWRDDLPALTADPNSSAPAPNPSGSRASATPPRSVRKPAPAPGSNLEDQEINTLASHNRYSSF